MDIKMIVSDLDGTFMLDYSRAHPDNIRAVDEARAKGLHFCASTGRTWTMARAAVRQANFNDLAMTSNGVAIIDTRSGEHVFFDGINGEHLMPILQTVCETGHGFELFCGKFIASCKGHTTQNLLMLEAHGKSLPEGVGEQVVVFDTLEQLEQECCDCCEEICVGVADGEWMPQPVVDKLSELGQYDLTVSHENAVDILPGGVSKARTLAMLAEQYGLEPENVIAFGDNINDIEMIQWAGVGVAMANADDRLKAVADMTADSNTNGGVAKLLRELHII